MFEDKTLVCKDCGKEFVWTAGEQEFYASDVCSSDLYMQNAVQTNSFRGQELNKEEILLCSKTRL